MNKEITRDEIMGGAISAVLGDDDDSDYDNLDEDQDVFDDITGSRFVRHCVAVLSCIFCNDIGLFGFLCPFLSFFSWNTKL